VVWFDDKYSADSLVKSSGSEDATTAATPGKNSLTGNTYLDGGAKNDREAAGRMMDSPTRNRVCNEVELRILGAGNQCQDAIGSLRTDILTAHTESDVPWLVALVMSMAATYVSGALSKAVGLLLAGGKSAESMIAALSQPQVDSAVAETPEHISTFVEKLTDQGKDVAAKPLKEEDGSDDEAQKQEKANWLDLLNAEVHARYEALRTSVLGDATDGDLLALLCAFNAKHHTIPIYKPRIQEKLARFENSGLWETRSGMTAENEGRPTGLGRRAAPAWSSGGTFADRTVVRVEFTSGAPPRYAFQTRTTGSGPTDAMEVQANADGKLNQDKWKASSFTGDFPVDAASSDIGAYISPEFEAAVVARNIQVWGEPPRVVTVDDSDRIFANPSHPTGPGGAASPVQSAATHFWNTAFGSSGQSGDSSGQALSGRSATSGAVVVPDALKLKPTP
jgi:hypothetical protein